MDDKYTQAIYDIVDALTDDRDVSLALMIYIEDRLDILGELIQLAKEVGIVEEVDD